MITRLSLSRMAIGGERGRMTPGLSRHTPSGPNGSFIRRLVAIAFADVVGYSTLMAADEEGTHARWMAIRRDLLEGKLRAHRGHLVKSTGDGILAEFASVLNAVAWSRDVQDAMRALPAAEGGAGRFELRISVHLCEVIEDESDLYGDGVNVAARLQQYAPPGGIIVSEAVYDVVRVAIDLEAKALGQLLLRNMARPVRAFVIDPERSQLERAKELRAEVQPSIAVLPLHMLSSDPADAYFGEGIVEDIVVSLAGLRELLVIARSSTLIYAGQQPDPRDFGRTLGVRYVLMGSVRRSVERLRVAIQLCDTATGASLWADSYMIAVAELFDVQEEIVTRVVSGIAPNVRAAELRQAMRKRPESFSAYDHTLRALVCIHSLDRDVFMQAEGLLQQAIEIDPGFAMPLAWLARWHSLLVGQGWSLNPGEDASRGIRLAAQAIDLDQQNALALATFAHMKSFHFHDYGTALTYFGRARAACPSSALAWSLSSGTLSYIGQAEEAVLHAERGLRLSPHDRSLFFSYFFLGLAHYVAEAYEEAVKWGRLTYSENGRFTATLRLMAVTLAALGRRGDAREMVQALLRLEPGFSLSRYVHERQPFPAGAVRRRYLAHLKKAGFPD
jgi:adenylate cyclase